MTYRWRQQDVDGPILALPDLTDLVRFVKADQVWH